MHGSELSPGLTLKKKQTKKKQAQGIQYIQLDSGETFATHAKVKKEKEKKKENAEVVFKEQEKGKKIQSDHIC